MKAFDYYWYKLIRRTGHFHNLEKELLDLKKLLDSKGILISSMVDVGCGDGEVTKKLKGLLEIDKVEGIDVNEELLKKASEKGIKTYLADFNNLNFDKRYDLALCFGSLHHSPNKQRTIKNIVKLSKKYVLIVDLTVRNTLLHKITNNRFYRFDATSYLIWSKKQIEEELIKNGCKIIGSHTNLNANYFHDRSLILAECPNK